MVRDRNLHFYMGADVRSHSKNYRRAETREGATAKEEF